MAPAPSPLRPAQPSLSAAMLLGLIAAYQAVTRVCLRPRCRFAPSCSQYAKEALSTLPLHRALWATAWRLLRCQPFSAGGHDPVPTA